MPFIVLLGILIFVHELGHFLVARWCGVRVEVFSLGFGKKIFSYKKGDTTYCISIVPLGGYVKMFGEQPGAEISEEDKKHSFTHKTVWQRIAVVLAGPLMNFFFAVLLFWALAMMGEEMHKPLVGDLDPKTPAAVMGFQPGDLIKEINGQPVETYEDFSRKLTELQNKQATVIVQRSSGNVEIKANITSKPNPNILSVTDKIGDLTGLTILSKGTFVGIPVTSPLHQAGLRTGDRIESINGQPVKYWRDFENILKQIPVTSPLSLEVSRYIDDTFSKSEKLSLTFAGDRLREYSTTSLQIESSEMYLAKVAPKSPAFDAGLKQFDRILSIDGKPLTSWEDIVSTIKSFGPQQEFLKFEILRDGQPMTLEIKPLMTTQQSPTGVEDRRYTVGIYPLMNYAESEMVTIRTENIATGFVRGVTRTWDVSVMMVMSFVRLFENKISAKNIGGVISIGQAASETYKMGLDKFLQMMALISVNLFILNLLPVPVLDGGHLVFYTIEAIKGSPLSLKKMEMAQQVGLVLLMSLMVFALFNDITRIFFN